MSREELLLEIMRRDARFFEGAEFVEVIREMRQQGVVVDKIARETGLSTRKVRRICQTYQIPWVKRASESDTAG